MNRIALSFAVAGITLAASSANAANIVETAQQAGSFKTLLAAAQAPASSMHSRVVVR